MTGNDEPNPYLARRQAKMARNEAKLRTLGLWKATTTASTVRNTQSKKPQEVAPVAPTAPTRRSKRFRYITANTGTSTSSKGDVYEEEDSGDEDFNPVNQNDDDEEDIWGTTTIIETQQQPRAIIPKKRPRPSPTKQNASAVSFPPHSARSIDINVSLLLQHFLGIQLPVTGKAAVMEACVKQAATRNVKHTASSISFNKYSGVQEWRNDVVFVWINFQGPLSDVINEVDPIHKTVTWFGGSRMHGDTPIIQRLQRISKQTKVETSGVVLWCRQYDAKRKSFPPYTCLGRLGVSLLGVLVAFIERLFLTKSIIFFA